MPSKPPHSDLTGSICNTPIKFILTQGEMLSSMDPTDHYKVHLFFKILMPHAIFRYIESEICNHKNI